MKAPELANRIIWTTLTAYWSSRKILYEYGYWYHQIPIDEESQNLLVISTPMGRYKFTVLAQGVCLSSDIFNFLTDGSMRYDSSGAIKNMDDALLHGRTIKVGSKFTNLKILIFFTLTSFFCTIMDFIPRFLNQWVEQPVGVHMQKKWGELGQKWPS